MCHIDYQYNYTTTIQDFQWILALLLTNYYMAEYYFYFALSTNYILTALSHQLSQQFANSNSNCKFKFKICKVEIFKKVKIFQTQPYSPKFGNRWSLGTIGFLIIALILGRHNYCSVVQAVGERLRRGGRHRGCHILPWWSSKTR